jgi:hypothetical protein
MSEKDAEEAPSPRAGSRQDTHALISELGAGRPVPGGAGPAQARFHDDAAAARIASAHSAHGFAVGGHVGIGADAPRPGTLRGDLLIAHELAHAAQQAKGASAGGASVSELEADADRAALLGVEPQHGSSVRLHLRSCGSSASDIETFRHALLTDLADPVANEAKIIAEIDAWGTSDFEDVVKKVIPLKGGPLTGELMRTPAGQRIVAKARAVLAGSSDLAVKIFVKDIDAELARRATPGRTYKPAEEAELAKVRAAIAAETPARKALYGSVSPPLDLDVKLYQPGMEMAGGVYYDPYMTRGPAGTAGETEVQHSIETYGTAKFEFRNFGNFIRLGPLAIASDDRIRSSLFHEFQHYRLGREMVKGAASKDPAAVALEAMPEARLKPNDEVEVIGLQIADDVTNAKLPPADVASNLVYLATQLETGSVDPTFRDRAFTRIVDAAKTSPAGLKAILAAFRLLAKSPSITAPQLALIDPLRVLLLALTAPKPKPAKKGP